MPWGRERGAGVSPLCQGCPATAPRASPTAPRAWPGLTVHVQHGDPSTLQTLCAPPGPHRCPLFLGVPRVGAWGTACLRARWPMGSFSPPQPRRNPRLSHRCHRAGPGTPVPDPAQAVRVLG